MGGAIRSLPQYASMAWYSLKAQGQLYLLVVDWIHLAQDKDQWRAVVKTVMNLRVP
jgi:hypothetical protein